MFTTIFRYELQHWARQPSVYIYAAVFFLMAAGIMWGTASEAGGGDSGRILNAPFELNFILNYLHKLVLFLLPAIIGLSVYRDFQSNMHHILYTYPFTKNSYLSAKFASALIVVLFIISTIGIGLFIGARMPGVQAERIGPFHLAAYLQAYVVYILPNILLFGAIVFAIVTFTRNIYAGFITVLLLLFIQGIVAGIHGDPSQQYLAAILDPFGQRAIDYSTRYWTMAERNERLLPVESVLIYNRLLWLGISALIIGLVYKYFSFGQNAISIRLKRGKESTTKKHNFGSITTVSLPKVSYDFSFGQQLKTSWALSQSDFRYITTSWLFISILLAGILFIFFQQAQFNPPYGIKALPVTWAMLRAPAFLFLEIIQVLTFLYAGMLVFRARISRMNQLLDINPIPNWALLLSKFLALVKMQLLLLSLIAIGGIAVQLYRGYYHFEIGHYLFELYGLHFIRLAIWAFAALFIQTLLTNPYLGLFLLILGAMGMAGLPELGIESYVFRFNMGPELAYSDLDGYGATLLPYWYYKIYWLLLGLFLFPGALCWWTRGLPLTFPERFRIAFGRAKGKTGWAMAVLLAAFLTLGARIYYETEILNPLPSQEEEDRWMAENEKKYKQYQYTPQPRIVSVQINMDIFPESRAFNARGTYILVNKSPHTIDSLLIHYSFEEATAYRFNRPVRLLSRDTAIRFDLLRLEQGLAPGDSLAMNFDVQSRRRSLLDSHTKVKSNGTFVKNNLFPGLGYRPLELTDNGKRAKYGLSPSAQEIPHPSDSLALSNSYTSNDSDWITFEATVSTSEDQTAIAPGYLQKEWVENGRRYFHYKMDSKIKNYYGFNSGRFELKRDQWNDVSLEIYYHQGHDQNLGHMMSGLKGALAYNSEHFSPYQHRQARIIEFPATYGRYATTFANSVPFSENYFILDVDDSQEEAIGLPFYVAAHEIAHQWWGNQLLPADVAGSKMLTESLAEYVALKVLEKEYGENKLRYFLQFDLDLYLSGRAEDGAKERPLMYAHPNQEYVNYRKGGLAFYTLSDYIGEEKLNNALKAYLEKVKFQEAPYTTSLEMLPYLRNATPDSLSYLIEDLFETITLYDNQVTAVHFTPLPKGQYRVDVAFLARKYRSQAKGHRTYGKDSLSYQPDPGGAPLLSLPLADYIEIGVFGEADKGGSKEGRVLYLQKHKVSQINNEMSFIVGQKPLKVAVDPYSKLIDANREDNWSRF